MEKEKLSVTLMHNFFIVLLTAGIVMLVVTFAFMQEDELFSGIRQISIGIFMIGIGEWMSHPPQKSMNCEGDKELTFNRFQHRKRNPSPMGNIFEIIGLILLFTGAADYI